MKARYTLLLLLVAFLLLAGCTSTSAQKAARQPAARAPDWKALPVNSGGFRDISVVQLADLLKQQDVLLVNTHIPYEGELPNTDLFVPYNEIPKYVDKLPADKDALIVLYCRSGSMSTSAGAELAKMGYRNLLELDGGMVAWKAAGQPLENKR